MTIASRCGRCNVRNALTIALAAALQLSASSAFAQANSNPSKSNFANASVDTKTPVFAASQCAFSGGVTDDDNLNITVSLQLQNKAQLDSYVHDLYTPGNPNYHQFLSQKQATDLYAPTPEQAQAVADFLTKKGFTNVAIASNRMLVTAQATTSQAKIAFKTALANCQISDGTSAGRVNTSSVQVPTTIASVVDQVLGLQTVNRVSSLLARPQYGLLDIFPGYPATTLASAYNADSLPAAANTEAAIIGWGDMTHPVDSLKAMETSLGIKNVPTEVKVYGNPNSTTDGGDITGSDTEFEMDAQAIVGMSGGVKKLTFYTAYSTVRDAIFTSLYNMVVAPNPQSAPADNWATLIQNRIGGGPDDGSLLQAINGAVADDTAKVINMSFGEGECSTEGSSGNLGYADGVFELGVVQGQTFVAASGDNGAFPCFQSRDLGPLGPFFKIIGNGLFYGSPFHPSAVYPASSPYVIAVGGSTIQLNSQNKYGSESTWQFGGAGTSVSEAIPFWQSNLTGNYRKVPDIAFDGDPINSGMLVYDETGKASPNGGTSLSAPLFAGAWARLQSAHNNQLGFAAPMIYYAAIPKAGLAGILEKTEFDVVFHDIQNGWNGYFATQGWDNATGWGSFDVGLFNTYLNVSPWLLQQGNQSPTTPAPWN